MILFRCTSFVAVLLVLAACGTEVERIPGRECSLALFVHTPPSQDAFAGVHELRVQLFRPDEDSVIRRVDPSATEFVLTASPVEGASLLLEGLDAVGTVLASGQSAPFDLEPQVAADVHLLFARKGEFARLLGTLGVGRFGHSLTALPDGRVLVMGGASEGDIDSPSVFAGPEIYDPRTQSSCAMPDSNCPVFSGADLRFGHTATSTDQGKVVIFGGYDENGNTESSVLVFESEADAFRKIQNVDITKVLPRAHHAAAQLLVYDESSGEMRDSILFAGGEKNGASAPEVLSSVLLFDTHTEIFTRTDLSLGQARSRAIATTFGPESEFVLLSGGENEQGLVGPVELFRGAEFIDWRIEGSGAGTDLHSTRTHHLALPFEGGVLVVGGDDGELSLDAPELFFYGGDLGTGMFSLSVASSPPTHTGKRGALGVVLESGSVLLAGGETLGTGERYWTDSVELLVHEAGSQQVNYFEMDDLPGARSFMAWCKLPGGGILMAGGLTSGVGGPVSSGEVWYYNP